MHSRVVNIIAGNSKIGESFGAWGFRFFYYSPVFQRSKKIVCFIKTFANTTTILQTYPGYQTNATLMEATILLLSPHSPSPAAFAETTAHTV